ncbi:hypothetical protein VBX60_001727 [Campylobacter jejuni]|uniref:Uncharacterized protein n=1 Tax=Campylobacter jejuni TaxID=197 RepID=A0AAN3QYX0_CAMJU|nr:hypothetical protein [Campylobacter jejuni]EAI9739266.1 hypothetical protein [Campylobacter jejuni]EAK2198252.1 hypothetical protein [Campylobacter jejuni]EAK3496120.1 hypothetical protein [Campylobacter jejuni]EAL1140869.1 hypothetical protein [Campylobacter jejuni]ECL7251364.1 hypothetical protein [Campylobacter jejuni]
MSKTNPFKKIDFIEKEKKEKDLNDKLERKFIEEARGETSYEAKLKKNKLIIMEYNLYKRLIKYISEKGSRVESQNYVINLALDDWLTKKGF